MPDLGLPRELNEPVLPLPEPTTLAEAREVIAAYHRLIGQQQMTKQSQLNLIHSLNDRLTFAIYSWRVLALTTVLLLVGLILTWTHVIN